VVAILLDSLVSNEIVDPGQILWDHRYLHVLPIEEATVTCMLRRGQTITYKKNRNGIA
jgi:hypothetical protein